ncbi:MAG: flavodoxin domain-containing protein, partial [Thermoproteota archaeon]
MAKVFVVYESKYGNTGNVAKEIIEGLNEAEGIEVLLKELKKADLEEVQNYDVLLIGSPNHIGGPTRG